MSPPYASFESSDTSGASLLNTTTVLGSFTNIHERPIFWSLATNLGYTFKAPKNLGARVTSITPVTSDDIASYFFQRIFQEL